MAVAGVWFLILISTLVLNHVSRSKYRDYWSFIQKEGLKDQWKRNCDMRLDFILSPLIIRISFRLVVSYYDYLIQKQILKLLRTLSK